MFDSSKNLDKNIDGYMANSLIKEINAKSMLID
jgi:hypothetical protein